MTQDGKQFFLLESKEEIRKSPVLEVKATTREFSLKTIIQPEAN